MKTASELLGTSVAALALGASLVGHAGIYDFTSSAGGVYTASASGLGQVIPDNDAAGVAYALDFGAAGLHVSDIQTSKQWGSFQEKTDGFKSLRLSIR